MIHQTNRHIETVSTALNAALDRIARAQLTKPSFGVAMVLTVKTSGGVQAPTARDGSERDRKSRLR